MRLRFISAILSFLFVVSPLTSYDVVINEIHSAPAGNEPEWIELYNYSGADIVISPAYIADAVASVKINSITIKAGSYTVITRDTASLLQKRTLPEEALLLEAKIPQYNNTWDYVLLFDGDSTLIDSVYYNFSWGKTGVSFERVDYLTPAVSSDNLKPSLSADSATMGYENSRAIIEYDASLEFSTQGFDNSVLILIVSNKGRNKIENVKLSMAWDKDKNGIGIGEEVIFTKNIDFIEAEDIIEVSFTRAKVRELIPQSGYVNLIAYISSESDKRLSNDSIFFTFFSPYKETIVTINEFMYDISPGKAEFLELYNSTSDTVNLFGWYINDAALKSPKDYFRIDDSSTYIAPGSYAVIAWDTLFFSTYPELRDNKSVFVKKKNLNLNQSGDDIVLRTPDLLVHDSVQYSNNWHISTIPQTKDISLEKRSPTMPTNSKDSWSSCTAPTGATPMASNSIYIFIDTSSTLKATPNPFSAKKNEACIVSYTLPFIAASLNAIIYDANGNYVRNLSNLQHTGKGGTLVWDGRNDEGFLLQSGPYVIYIEASDALSSKVYNDKMMLVIGN